MKGCLFTVIYHGELEFSETVRNGESSRYYNWLKDRVVKGKITTHAITYKQEIEPEDDEDCDDEGCED